MTKYRTTEELILEAGKTLEIAVIWRVTSGWWREDSMGGEYGHVYSFNKYYVDEQEAEFRCRKLGGPVFETLSEKGVRRPVLVALDKAKGIFYPIDLALLNQVGKKVSVVPAEEQTEFAAFSKRVRRQAALQKLTPAERQDLC